MTARFGARLIAALMFCSAPIAQVAAQTDQQTRDFGNRPPTLAGVPLPMVKPMQPAGFERERETRSARASRLFAGQIGDSSLGEGVIIFGPSDGGDLSLDLLQQLGADSARGLNTQDNTLGVAGGVQLESEQMAFLRDRAQAAAALVAKEPPVLFNYARLRALNKVTARLSNLVVPVGSTELFGTLSITVQSCQKTPPSEPPESASFLIIEELGENDVIEQRFSGWMFASNPAISGLEHAVYDVWVAGCTNASSASSGNFSPNDG